jgi:hypothetical protein
MILTLCRLHVFVVFGVCCPIPKHPPAPRRNNDQKHSTHNPTKPLIGQSKSQWRISAVQEYQQLEETLLDFRLLTVVKITKEVAEKTNFVLVGLGS